MEFKGRERKLTTGTLEQKELCEKEDFIEVQEDTCIQNTKP